MANSYDNQLVLSNSYKQLFDCFSKFSPLSDALKDEIKLLSSIASFPKKYRLLNEGEKSDSIYFILNGGIRVFYLDKDGAEINTWFLFEDELAISVYSFFSGFASFENIETIEETTVVMLKRSKLEQLYLRYPEFNVVGRKLTEFYYIRNEVQANSLRTMSAKERYVQLVNSQPQVSKRVPLGYIASYLGISAETLSRIRKQI